MERLKCRFLGFGDALMGFRSSAVAVLALAIVVPAFAQWTPLDPVVGVKQSTTGAVINFKSGGTLKLKACRDSVIHVLYSPTGSFPAHKEYVVTKSEWPPEQV